MREHHNVSESSRHERILPTAPRLNYSCFVLFTSRVHMTIETRHIIL